MARKKQKVSILMLTYNAPFYTLQSIMGVKCLTDKNNVEVELIVVDNLSAILTRLLLRVLKFVRAIDKLHLNNKNSMFSGGNNIAASLADEDSDMFLLLNSDIKVNNRYWMQKLINHHDRGVTAYGVCNNPLRVDGYCYLIDSNLYNKYPLDENHEWWWSITKQQAKIMQEYSVIGIKNHESYIHHYGGKSGNIEVVASAKGMSIDIDEIEGWFKGKSPKIIDFKDLPR